MRYSRKRKAKRRVCCRLRDERLRCQCSARRRLPCVVYLQRASICSREIECGVPSSSENGYPAIYSSVHYVLHDHAISDGFGRVTSKFLPRDALPTNCCSSSPITAHDLRSAAPPPLLHMRFFRPLQPLRDPRARALHFSRDKYALQALAFSYTGPR